MAVVRQHNVDICYSPEELAAIFCAMCDDEQGQFFENVKQIMDSWPFTAGRNLQLIAIASDMPAKGRELIEDLHSLLLPATGE